MIVVDTNVVAYLLIEGKKTALAQKVYRRDNHWLLPPLWRHEFLSVVSSFVRYGGGREEAGLMVWTRGLALFGGSEREVELKEALHLSIAGGVSAYDAQFAALARDTGAPLVTDDRKLLDAFPDLSVSMQGYVDTGRP